MSDIIFDDHAVTFISDWKKRADEQQKKYVIIFIAMFILAFGLCILSFSVFQYANYNRVVDQNQNYIQDSAIQEANQIERNLEHSELSAITLATRYATLLDYQVGDTIEDRLEILRDKSVFDRIAYIEPGGGIIGLEGATVVSDRGYFRKAMNGESGWDLLIDSRISETPTVVFYSPILSRGKVIGVMAGFYDEERLGEMFSYQMFHYTPNSFLLLGDGAIIASSVEGKLNDNLLDWLSTKEYTGESDYDDILAKIESPERTIVSFSFTDSSRTSVGVIVQFAKSDWMLFSMLPQDITAGMVDGANRDGLLLLVSIMFIFLLTVVLLLYFLGRQRKALKNEIAMASENLQASVRNDRVQYSIIQSLANIFSSVYYVDLVRSQYTRIKEKEGNVAEIPDSGDAEKGFSTYVEHYINVEYLPEMRVFLDAATFRPRMEETGMMVKEYQRADGGWRRGTLIPAEQDAQGHISSLIFAVQEIDQEKKKELTAREALQEAYEAVQMANSAKTTFLSNMSHDIRTPMNAIIGMTTIAATHLDDPGKVSECLKKITSSSKHLLGLINEILDMSKIESGKVDLSEEDFSLPELIDNLVSIHQPLLKEKNHFLVVKVHSLTHEKVIGDPTRLQQVFTNLLGNAIKYTPAGGRIEVTLSEKENNKPTTGLYEVTFRDNGIGMSEESQRTLFDPFTRASDQRIAKIQGTGLGMPIARNIIQMMNGNITVESRINEGSTFTVSFVLKLQPDESVNYASFVDLPVLVVDDDLSACESTCAILDDLSMDSEWVTTGREAVEKVMAHHGEERDYYAVIVDWKMPGMDGLETTREIRRQVGGDMPIIVISAYDWSDIEQEAKEAGVNAFLSKPLFKSKIVNLFRELSGEQEADNVKNPAAEIQKYDFSGKRLLLVEDNELNREIAVELLQMAGFETDSAEDGKIGVEKFAVSKPGFYDLILMDIRMPVMNGYEAAKAIRAMARPDASKIPIIAMTADAFSSDVRDALNAGMNGHIAKPISIDRVLKVLEEHLS